MTFGAMSPMWDRLSSLSFDRLESRSHKWKAGPTPFPTTSGNTPVEGIISDAPIRRFGQSAAV